MASSLRDYQLMPYERVWETRVENHDIYFVVRLKDIPRIAGDGTSRDDALRNFRAAFDDYITWAIDERVEIPAPSRPVLCVVFGEPVEWKVQVDAATGRTAASPEALPASTSTRIAERSADQRYAMARA
ncbi:MAG: hypothetical protein U1E29_14450 [Coriobacteriia bacterium]|nr:hypothetical protein [Coriobacteriia bacterium]